MMRTKRQSVGMSLVETLVAGVILSGTVVTVAALGTRSLTGAREDRAYEKAASLLDRQLTLIDYIGIDAFIEMNVTQGDFGDIAPDYRWEAGTEYLDVDNLYRVTLTVYWFDHSRIRSLSVQARFNGRGTATTTGGAS